MLPVMSKRRRPSIDVFDGVHFSDVTTRQLLTVCGGFNKRRKEALAIQTAEFVLAGENSPTRFFYISKTEPWFCKIVSGRQCMGRLAHHITLLDLLRDKIKAQYARTAQAMRHSNHLHPLHPATLRLRPRPTPYQRKPPPSTTPPSLHLLPHPTLPIHLPLSTH